MKDKIKALVAKLEGNRHARAVGFALVIFGLVAVDPAFGIVVAGAVLLNFVDP